MIARAWIGFAGLVLVGCGEAATADDAGLASDAFASSDDAALAPDAVSAPDAGPIDAGPLRMEPTLPMATGACPDMTATGMITVAPTGITPRDALIWVGPEAAATDGPVVFFWHGAGGSPTEAPYALGDALDAITTAGGIVVAPFHDPTAPTFPWFLTTGGTREDDLLVADELLACAEAGVGVDDHHVHSVGFSAGALHTTQMSFRRASYLASVVVYSGGLITSRMPPTDAPDARFAAMILYGGERDVVVTSFEDASLRYHDMLARNPGYFGFLCNHGMGHTVPSAARASAWQFLQDHPFGMHPHAYESGLPDGFYAPCTL
ncbi:MAG: hypothetical protein K1X94_15250 [Sandaracinaceae bacterium]|nr:hypothetical protein [Sandaracinaceae bacterium]